jgi:hypothetical protein
MIQALKKLKNLPKKAHKFRHKSTFPSHPSSSTQLTSAIHLFTLRKLHTVARDTTESAMKHYLAT